MENIIIREIQNKDIERVALLWFELSRVHENFTPYYDLNLGSETLLVEHVKEILARGCIIYVAEVDSNVVGFVSGYIVRRNPQLKIGVIGKIDNFYVDESFRRKGIGAKLIGELLSKFKALKALYYEISCDIQNPDALRLYKKLGFVEQKIMLLKYDKI